MAGTRCCPVRRVGVRVIIRSCPRPSRRAREHPSGCDSGQLPHCAVTGDRVQRDPRQHPHPLRYPQRLFDRELLADGLWT
ncbi:hypothetical protein [Streptomyces scopuliridis]|uniref:hypothetical protein n=1 Tax=Streptomyces scopuliridis TaxID=452529 RepID=UPI0035E1B493